MQRLIERLGNPLEWSNVDKCLLVAALTFPFPFVYVGLALFGLEHPDLIPYIDRSALPVVIQMASATAVGWLGIIGLCLVVRRRAPDSRWPIQIVGPWWVLGTVYIVYTYGLVTSPVAVQLLGGLLLGVLLFDFRSILPSALFSLALLVGLIAGERAGWIPYAQLMARPPLVDGRLSSFWVAMNFGLFISIAALIFATASYVIVRWRDREAQLAEITDLLRRTFGRYLSPQVMASLLADPRSIELAGQRRRVSIMMTDIRGFVPLSERLGPERVVSLLNRYLTVMTEICDHYHGTVNDIIGDALQVTFGAPAELPHHPEAAVACAIDMQNAMEQINAENFREGLPAIEMGVGINTADVIVGNIGSERRSKYGVVGSGVNLASRIESYTVGGQILVTESVVAAIPSGLRIDDRREVTPKGSAALTIYEVGGISGRFDRVLLRADERLAEPARPVVFDCVVLCGEQAEDDEPIGPQNVQRLSKQGAELAGGGSLLSADTNLRLNLVGVSQEIAHLDFYAKVGDRETTGADVRLRFTSLPPEISAYFEALIPKP